MSSLNDEPALSVKAKASSPRRRWLRFSLRTMLIILTAVVVLLALWTNNAKRQQQAIKNLETAGWNVGISYDREFSGNREWIPRWIAEKIGRDYFHNIERIALTVDNFETPNTPDTTKQAFESLSNLPHIKFLAVVDGPRKQADKNELLKVIPLLLDIKELNLHFSTETRLEKEDMEKINKLHQLQSFMAINLVIDSEETLSKLSAMRQLDCLFIHTGTDVSINGLQVLKPLTNLKKLDIESNNDASSDAHIRAIAQTLPNLDVLVVQVNGERLAFDKEELAEYLAKPSIESK